MGRLLARTRSALLLTTLMFAGSLLLWLGLPLAWLWLASRIQDATGSVGAAIGAAMPGFVLSVALLLPALGWLSNRYREERVARGLEDIGHFALEVTVVSSAFIALALFLGWFFLFSGSAPFPV